MTIAPFLDYVARIATDAPRVMPGALMDSLPDSPDLAHYFCPGCRPEVDPIAEPLATVRWCERHEPSRAGAVDRIVEPAGLGLTGYTESEGETNRAYAARLHRPHPA